MNAIFLRHYCGFDHFYQFKYNYGQDKFTAIKLAGRALLNKELLII